VKRILLVLLLAFGLSGCFATQKDITRLERKIDMQMFEGAGSDFRPFTALTGGGAGAVDKPTGTENGDAGFLVLEADATYGDMFFPYVLDVDGGSDDSLPEYIEAGDGGSERWTLCHGAFGGLLLHDQSANDPSPISDVAGWLTLDHDGANETGDMTLRVNDGTNEALLARKIEDIHITVPQPNDMDDTVRDHVWFWTNKSGMTFTVTSIYGISDTDNTTLAIYEEDGDGQNDVLLDNDQNSTTCEIATDGTDMYYMTAVTAIDNPTIEAGHHLYLDFDDTDDPGQVKLVISGWFNADVD